MLAPDKEKPPSFCGCEIVLGGRSLFIRRSGSSKVLRDWLHLVDKGADASCIRTGLSGQGELRSLANTESPGSGETQPIGIAPGWDGQRGAAVQLLGRHHRSCYLGGRRRGAGQSAVTGH